MKINHGSLLIAICICFTLSMTGCSSGVSGNGDTLDQKDNTTVNDGIEGDATDDVSPEPDSSITDHSSPDTGDTKSDTETDTSEDNSNGCEDVGCLPTCVTDADCPEGFQCVETADGCCSECSKKPCGSDADCEACESCAIETGECVALPCVSECVVDEECGDGEVCVTQPEGCCGVCVVANQCESYECLSECSTDYDCEMGYYCIQWGDGCCAECKPQCEICYLEAGEYCAVLPAPGGCEVGSISVTEAGPCWFEITYTGQDGVDILMQNGCMDFVANLPVNGCSMEFISTTRTFEVACNWCGEVVYDADACSCIPDCEGKQCGPNGCGGVCGSCEVGGTCTEGGLCAGCDSLVELQPLCVHFPTMVQAGGEFAVAVYGDPGCTPYVEYKVTATQFDINVTLWGQTSADPVCEPLMGCSAQASRYLGLVLLDAPNPGVYNLNVGGFTGSVIASGGIIESPACLNDCPSFSLANYQWTVVTLSQNQPMDMCLDSSSAEWLGLAADISGSCQNYTLGSLMSLPETPVYHCTESRVLFGETAPYWMEATLCGEPTGGYMDEALLLGTIQEPFVPGILPTQAFLISGVPVVN